MAKNILSPGSKKYTHLKELAYEANREIPRLNLAIFTFGNVSAFDPDLGALAIKPSGVPYAGLGPQDMVVLDLDGTVIQGKLRPSSDTPTHLELYRSIPGIRGIVHTHSTYATSWAQAARAIPLYGTTHADFSPEAIPCVPFLTAGEVAGAYEANTGTSIVKHFATLGLDFHHCPMTLLAGHGPFTWGEDPQKAVYHAAVLEQIAYMAWMTESLGQTKPLPAHYGEKHFSRKHGPNAYYGQSNHTKV